jgi:LysR family glycine cleavage system transcriptional activator
VELTEAGQIYLTYVHESFEKLRTGQQKIEQFNNRNGLLITAPPSVASKWLMPKLFKWMELNPEVEMRIDASNTPVNFNASISDFSVCFGDTGQPGLLKMEMFRDTISPVCSPALLNNYTGDVYDLLHQHPLIHIDWGDENIHLPSWDDWLQYAGLQHTPYSRGIQLNYSSMAIEAAVQGKGIMLGQMTLVQEELNAGKLVQISSTSLPLNKSYYLIYPKRTLLKPMASEFLDWLTIECKRFQ